jgi:8-oxo-dGTP diphosphatase
MARDIHLIVAGIVRRGDDVLLVQQQGPHDPAPTWALPGGLVEDGELLTEALAREVREETGIIVERMGALAYVTQVDGSVAWPSLVFVFEIAAWHGDPRHGDPDGLVVQAAFVPLADAIARLEQLPWPAMRDPAVAYLRGASAPGSVWLYHGEMLSAECW